ncbi:hypothetical protein [Granulicella sp. dw_53]|uniref:cupin domain-containing protein n=1 Tax=Granulicella sp. dw_53 TaxID=2719792 RepID=UPI001BD1CD36|nr:hypothetical protein [Granulicella sp. dw_53]
MTFATLNTVVAFTFMALTVSSAQTSKIDVYTAEQLTASSTKAALKPGETPSVLEHYPNHYTMLITRRDNGQSELHEHVADVFFVAGGSAQLWTGGSMQNDKVTEPGEHRGSGLFGASVVSLKRGDLVHIPANVPHQLRLAPGDTFTYFVVKVHEDSAIAPLPKPSR